MKSKRTGKQNVAEAFTYPNTNTARSEAAAAADARSCISVKMKKIKPKTCTYKYVPFANSRTNTLHKNYKDEENILMNKNTF